MLPLDTKSNEIVTATSQATAPSGSGEKHNEITCWLCNEESFLEDLILPCECSPKVGISHRQCLLDWINTLYKGRCPRCAFQYRMLAEKTPFRDWKFETRRYVFVVVINIIVSIMCCIAFGYFMSMSDSDETLNDDVMEPRNVTSVDVVEPLNVTSVDVVEPLNVKRSTTKILLAAGTAVGYCIYTLYHIKVYCNLYERVRIYNNTVWFVYDILETPNPEYEVRRNDYSFVN